LQLDDNEGDVVLIAELKLCRLLLLVCCTFTSACTTISYYAQSISGQVEIMIKQRPIAEIILAETTDPVLKQKLIEIESILDFAHQHLGLPDNGSYRKFVDLDRRFVVWNVFAAPELSLQAKQWCYLIVGCMTYRGYFNEQAANTYARSLQDIGWEVYVGGVSAYSTLGWFRDPVLNTMLNRDSWELARLLFHELAHQRLYIANDTDFNEAFADTVALIGLDMWLQTSSTTLKETVDRQLQLEQEFIDLVLAAREELAILYNSQLSDTDKRSAKSTLLQQLKFDYEQLTGNQENSYAAWIDNVNNARLSALSAYRTLVPDMLEAYENTGSDLNVFFAWIEGLADCDKEQRRIELRKSEETTAC
jgi:predicted aminopeptidase